MGNGLTIGTVEAAQLSGGVPYAGGSFTTPAVYIAKWDGQNWVAVGPSDANRPQTSVNALASISGILYVGGAFGSAGVKKWDGAAWSNIGGWGSDVYALVSHGPKLYEGGSFPTVLYYDTSASNPGWVRLGTVDIPQPVYAIAITDDGTVYAGGGSGTPFLYYWNGSAWASVAGSPTGGTAVRALMAVGNDLYVGGNFTTVGGSITVRGLAKLSGSTWSLPGGTPIPWITGSTVRAIGWNGSGEMCVTGYLPKDGGGTQNHFFLLINGAWASVPTTGLDRNGGTGDYGRALAVDRFAGKVYVGGSFDHAGGLAVNNVAVWNEFRSYMISDLGTLSANTYSSATALNNSGRVGGYSSALVVGSPKDHGFQWSSGTMQDLHGYPCSGGPWGANDQTWVYGANDANIFVGTADQNGSGTFLRGFRRSVSDPSCTWTLLGPPSGWTSARTEAFAINNNFYYDIVGRCPNNSGTNRAMRWPAGGTTATDLQTLISPDAPSYSSIAWGVNKAGYVVGQANFAQGDARFHAFRCDPAPGLVKDHVSNDLGTIGTGDDSIAYAINDFRQIVGESKWDSPNPYHHAFIKTPDSGKGQGFTDLGALLPGYAHSAALSINNSGQVVGYGSVTSYAGFIWQNDSGMKKLQDLLPGGSQWTIYVAEAINEQGVIVGYGYPCPTCTYAHAYMMTP